MDVLFFLLHAIFFAPLLQRLATRDASMTATHTSGVDRTTLTPHARPILFVHGAGLTLFYGGLVFAMATGNIARAVTVRGVIGTAVILVADFIEAWSFRAFRSWRLLPKVEPGHELCTAGPYALVRHPMYLAVDLLAVGSAVWVPTPPVVVAAVLLVVGGDLRARLEERVLIDAFGTRYREYRRRVRRTLPGIY